MNMHAIPSHRTSLPAAPASRGPVASTAGDGFAPGGTQEFLPTRQAMAAAVEASRTQATPMEARGAVNGLPMDWSVRPAGGDARLQGHQNGLPLEAIVHGTGEGAVEVEGYQNGRNLYVKIDRTDSGDLRVEGRRTGRGLSYVFADGGQGSLTARGGQDGMDAGFTISPSGDGLVLQGGVGGQQAGLRASAGGDRVSLSGGVHGMPLDVQFSGPGGADLARLGDFLPGLSPSERLGVLFILLSAAPR